MQRIQEVTAAQASKVDRKLYIGNLPSGLTPDMLMQLLNTALIQLQANMEPGGPITSCWISSDGHYSFAEFRSTEEATRGFALGNIAVLGHQLRVGRPKSYTGQSTDPTTVSKISDLGIITTASGMPITGGQMSATTVASTEAIGSVSTTQVRVNPESRVLLLLNMASEDDLESDEDYQEFLSEVKEQCEKYGSVVSVVIPRHGPGIKRVFVEYDSIGSANSARKALSVLKFDGKTVEATYYNEAEFASKKYDS